MYNDYKNSPLWKQAVEKLTESAINLNYTQDLWQFPEEQREIASVVLAYFNQKGRRELHTFCKVLEEYLKFYLDSDEEKVDHIYDCSIEMAESCRKSAEKAVERLVQQELSKSRNNADSSKNDANRSTEEHKHLNFL